MITFLPLGGANEIGASCFYLDIEGTGVILDSGSHPRKIGRESLPQFELVSSRNVDIALISHAHQDHIDSLPYLIQHHPYVRIVTTPQTRAIAELTLHNSANILAEQLGEQSDLRPYSHEEIDLLIQSIEWRAYNEQFTISGYRHQSEVPIIAQFYDAGHILGSAGIFLNHNGRTIFYTGDINIEKQTLLPGATLPKEHVDVLIIECTHGATDDALLPPQSEEINRLVTSANRILSQGGSILIPVFSLGKMQEIVSMLWKQITNGSLSTVDIYTGGIGKKISQVYDKNRYVIPYNNPEFLIDDIPQKDLYDVEQIEELSRRHCIVLASSGMVVEGTMSFRLAQRWLTDAKSAIFTVGYMDPETPGHRLRYANKGDLIQLTNTSEPQTVRCAIERFRFSAHSKRSGLLSIVQQLNPRAVILVHGENASINWLRHAILEHFPNIKLHSAEVGKQITLFE